MLTIADRTEVWTDFIMQMTRSVQSTRLRAVCVVAMDVSAWAVRWLLMAGTAVYITVSVYTGSRWPINEPRLFCVLSL